MKSVKLKFYLDGKEIQKIDDYAVYFTMDSTPVSKFFSAIFDNQIKYRDNLKKEKLPPHTKFNLDETLKNWVISLTGNKDIKLTNGCMSTRHKYNPAQNVQEALKSAERYQAKNGRKESLETERFGNFLLDEDEDFNWDFSKLKPEEKKVIEDWERKTFDGKAYGKGLLEDKVTPYDTASTSKEKTGVKHSEGKLFYELDFGFIKQLAERMQQNKENSKYALWNWKKPMIGEDIENLKQALLRHVLAVMEGEYEDDGRPFGHLESISNNVMMINYQLKQK